MTEFKRYLDSPATPALDDLLRSALDDAPGPGALGRVAWGVGVSTAALSSVGIAGALGGKAVAGSLETGGLAASGGALGGSAAAASGLAGAAGSGLAGAAGSAAVGLGAGNTLAVLGKTLVISMLSAGALSAGVVAIHDPSVLSDSNSASQAARVTRPRQGPAVAAGDHLPSTADFRRRVTSRQEATAANAEPETAEQALPPESAAQRGASAEPRATQSPATQPPVTAPLGASKGAQVSQPAGAQRPQSAAPARAAGATTEASRNGSALGLEVKRIDSARRALESKDAPRALAELESYERTREFGVLDREALLLRIQALVQQQRREQAKALAREYLERFPGDAHAPRLRGLLAAGAASVGAFPEE